jgi:hypothetical protein
MESLHEKFGGHNDMIQAGSRNWHVQEKLQSTLKNNPSLHGAAFHDDTQELGRLYSHSFTSPFSHLYEFLTEVYVKDAAKLIVDGGVYPLIHIMTFPGFSGLVFLDTSEGEKFVEELEKVKQDPEQRRQLLAR